MNVKIITMAGPNHFDGSYLLAGFCNYGGEYTVKFLIVDTKIERFLSELKTRFEENPATYVRGTSIRMSMHINSHIA